MAMQIENESSFRATLGRGFNLFLGSAFSILARDNNKEQLPTGLALTKELCIKFSRPDLQEHDLPLVSQIIKSKNRTEFNEYLLNRFKIGEYDPRYESITTLEVKRIFTTNIDDLMPKIFSKSKERYLNDLLLQGATFGDRDAVEYLPLHGNVLYPEPDFSFTPIETASAFANNPTQFQYLVSCLLKDPTIFLGYSFKDAGTLQALSHHFTTPAQPKSKWIQLRTDEKAYVDYFKSLGFEIIIGDTESIIDYFNIRASEITRPASSELNAASFSTGRIPSLNEAPVRPITDYFRGHAPVWHDILSQRIPTTKKYNRIINHIDSGRNVLLSGIPVCGKSTILMQAAAYYDTNQIKIFEENLTPEKATQIVSKIEGKGKLLLFIDNAGDSVDALDILSNCKDIQIVAADRSINIGFGSHRFKSDRFTNLDCSDLNEDDYQNIYDSIPPVIRENRMTVPEVELQIWPSTFEFIEKNVVGPSISDRFKDVLIKLRSTQIELHDLFVMICYVYSCHSPVSFDVVSRFIGAGGDYVKVYGVLERLGKLLSEVDTNNAQFVDLDDTQDHFTPRSQLIAETVVDRCRNMDFGRVYLDFHTKVPRLFIPRYSNFKRFGYRNGYAERVFQDWKEGEKFYLRVYKEDKNYFLKQQLAIFLGAKKQYGLAFKYIDEALTESKNKNPNIRHTHARLLFDANIDKAASDRSLKHNLVRSMEILEACHEYDKRQTNHALRFSEQAIKFNSVFPGAESLAYTTKAKTWLKEEIHKTPSLRYARRLLKDIERLN
ncbi:P-loop NTPase [Amorphus orientalis]|uniref:Novel STAND NTPase 5 domain-containing protein n=1 Tax=Amorphus orientalis TaxID=649198 RepID=A0AAE3VS34_9HYPH|nr:SIR2 family protein [Amorphus orientalis]MDQ0317342.1 hypothetical protein [Amorphus orientalis]